MVLAMATTTISLDDALLAQIREAAGANLSDWIARACRSHLLAEACRAETSWARKHPEEAALAAAEQSRQYLETEAEQYAQNLAEQLWKQRGGHGDGPSPQDRTQAEDAARRLLDETRD